MGKECVGKECVRKECVMKLDEGCVIIAYEIRVYDEVCVIKSV